MYDFNFSNSQNMMARQLQNERQITRLQIKRGKMVAKCSNPTETAYMMIEHHCKVTETDGHVIVHAEPA